MSSCNETKVTWGRNEMYCLNLCYFQVLPNKNKTVARVNIVMSVSLNHTQLKSKVIWQSNICSLFSAIKCILWTIQQFYISRIPSIQKSESLFYVPALQNCVGKKIVITDLYEA